jgi:NADH:ubiquinone oxidoreductase subunit F (NADH-binding)
MLDFIYGTEKSKGTKVFALAGTVNNTGLVEVPIGVPLGEIVYDIGGGIPNGKKFKAAQIGGPPAAASPASTSTSPSTTRASPNSARSWAPAAHHHG